MRTLLTALIVTLIFTGAADARKRHHNRHHSHGHVSHSTVKRSAVASVVRGVRSPFEIHQSAVFFPGLSGSQIVEIAGTAPKTAEPMFPTKWKVVRVPVVVKEKTYHKASPIPVRKPEFTILAFCLLGMLGGAAAVFATNKS